MVGFVFAAITPILIINVLVRPVVEEANKDAPNFSRIFKEMILVTSTDKPMLRAGKGTVTKKVTIQLYEPEIDAL